MGDNNGLVIAFRLWDGSSIEAGWLRYPGASIWARNNHTINNCYIHDGRKQLQRSSEVRGVHDETK